MYVYMYVHIHILYVHICILYVYMYVYICAYICIYTYIHLHSWKWVNDSRNILSCLRLLKQRCSFIHFLSSSPCCIHGDSSVCLCQINDNSFPQPETFQCVSSSPKWGSHDGDPTEIQQAVSLLKYLVSIWREILGFFSPWITREVGF